MADRSVSVRSSTTVVVSGSLAQRVGRAGHAWVFIQYLLGLRRLGHEVLFLDRVDDTMLVDEVGVERKAVDLVRWTTDCLAAVGLGDTVALRVEGGRTWVGVGEREARARIRDAVVIDVMGYLGDDPIADGAAARIFVDLDPGFTQLWDDLGLATVPRSYDRYLTVGTAIGSATCAVPTLELPWVTSLPPVVLDVWPDTTGDPARVTSIAAWRGLNEPIEWRGRRLGVRAHAFRPFATLPATMSRRFELCLDVHPADVADVELLRAGGWRILDPIGEVGTLSDYRSFIQRSGLELCIAKALHAELRTGWFSDRSACYLASGRPVAALDTGTVLPASGEGFITFSDLEGATAAVEEFTRNRDRHRKAARGLAEEHLDSDRVLRTWLDGLGR